MAFKDQVAADVSGVFLNLSEFAETRCFRYDGREYMDVPVVVTNFKEEDRHRLTTGLKDTGGRSSYADHLQGLFTKSLVVHMAKGALCTEIPEKGAKLSMTDSERFYHDYTISESGEAMGMWRLEIQRIDE